jgi:hypothetical protein
MFLNPFVQHLSNNITKETIIQRITFAGKTVLKRCTSMSFLE